MYITIHKKKLNDLHIQSVDVEEFEFLFTYVRFPLTEKIRK